MAVEERVETVAQWVRHARAGCRCWECEARLHVRDALRARHKKNGVVKLSHEGGEGRWLGGAVELVYPKQVLEWIRLEGR